MPKGELLNHLYKANLSMRATLVMNYLINRANQELTCFPAIKTMLLIAICLKEQCKEL